MNNNLILGLYEVIPTSNDRIQLLPSRQVLNSTLECNTYFVAITPRLTTFVKVQPHSNIAVQLAGLQHVCGQNATQAIRATLRGKASVNVFVHGFPNQLSAVLLPALSTLEELGQCVVVELLDAFEATFNRARNAEVMRSKNIIWSEQLRNTVSLATMAVCAHTAFDAAVSVESVEVETTLDEYLLMINSCEGFHPPTVTRYTPQLFTKLLELL